MTQEEYYFSVKNFMESSGYHQGNHSFVMYEKDSNVVLETVPLYRAQLWYDQEFPTEEGNARLKRHRNVKDRELYFKTHSAEEISLETKVEIWWNINFDMKNRNYVDKKLAKYKLRQKLESD